MRLKKITLASIVIFILLMLPVLYLSFVNRASGDDYGYGAYTRSAWMETHSLIALISAIGQTVRQYYLGWQGTWFSVAVFSLQPEVFSASAYVIVVFIMLFLWIGSTLYLFNQILYKSKKFNKWEYLLVSVWFLIISIEFIPSTRSAIYWFNGCAHYMLPFAMCQMVTGWLMKYSEAYKGSTFVGINVFMALIGGSNYQAALFVLITACYIITYVWFLRKDKRILRLFVPISIELVGLVISMKAPGNKVRGGEDFGLSVVKGVKTIVGSFLDGIRDIGGYIKERPLIFAGLILLFFICIAIFSVRKEVTFFQHPVLLSTMLFCLYSAMQAPAIYAGVDVSGGVYNMNFQVFLLTICGIMMIVAENIAIKIRQKNKIAHQLKMTVLTLGILICMVITFLGRSNIKTSTSYICLRYIISGEAADYKEQMDLQTRLMENEQVQNVVVPFINDIQGPLMHMPVTGNPDAWTNMVTAEFYGKDSVIAIERPRWMELYGNE